MSAEVITFALTTDAGSALHTFALPKNKLDATAAPGTGDDDADGYVAGSLWMDRTNDKGYLCTDNGTGAAVWQQIAGAGSGGAVSDGDKGDITVSSSGTVWTIDAGVVTYAKMQDVSATDKLLGRSTAGSGDVEEIACTAAGRAILDDADAAAQRTTLGLAIGTNVQAYDATLAALAAFNTNGIVTQTAADTFTGRTITGTADKITVTNGDGVSGNPTLTVAATYVGQTSITTLGTITTGTWTGTTIAIANGGTGQTTAYAAHDALSVKGADIASASTTDLSAATGNYLDVTGTTTITALGTAAAGVERTVRFTGATDITHNATSLIMPSGATVKSAAGDVATFRSLGSGNWRCTSYMRAAVRPWNDDTTPIGSVLPYAGSTIPTYFLECDGSAVSRTTYASLFTAIGTTWGTGDGSTTFNLPDFRGRTLLGAGTGSGLTARTLGGTGGAETVTLAASEIPAHKHQVKSPNGSTMYKTGGGAANNVLSVASVGIGAAYETEDNSGGGSAHANMQPWAAVKWMIRAL